MAGGALHSDHINYLIYRYLQEHGHESTAKAFQTDWHRPREFHDPEDLPFAAIVQRHELVTVVQKGLQFDELSTRHGPKDTRRFRWVGVNPRRPREEQHVEGVGEQVLQNGAPVGSRPSGGGRRKGKAAVTALRAPDEFPTPAPKRQRRSEGSEGVHLNGDAMDVHTSAASPSAAEGEEGGGEAVSPAVASDVEVMSVPERYDSMDVATQTEAEMLPKTSTLHWKIDKPGAGVMESAWNPNPHAATSTLLTVGPDLCRFHDIPEAQGDSSEVEHLDEPHVSPNACVTAAAWHPDGQTALCAVEVDRAPGDRRPRLQLLCHNREGETAFLDPGPPLLEPPGIVLCIRFSEKGEHVLMIRTNSKRGQVQVWRSLPPPGAEDQQDPYELIAWRYFEHQVLDACWTGEDRFLVSGSGSLAGAYRIDASAKSDDDPTIDSVATFGLIEQAAGLIGLPHEEWDRIRLDPVSNVAIFAAAETRLLLTVPLCRDEDGHLAPGKVNLDGRTDMPGRLTGLAFRPNSESVENSDVSDGMPKASFLATAFEQGLCVIYRLTRPDETSAYFNEVIKLSMADGAAALALAWSPDGAYLAVAGCDTVQVWRSEDILMQDDRSNGILKHVRCVQWRLQDVRALKDWTRRNGEEMSDADADAVEAAEGQPCLSWSADGASLGFAVDQQVSLFPGPCTTPYPSRQPLFRSKAEANLPYFQVAVIRLHPPQPSATTPTAEDSGSHTGGPATETVESADKMEINGGEEAEGNENEHDGGSP
jgi:WD40 repeat protein